MALWQLDVFKPAVFLGFIRSVPEPEPFQRARWLPNRLVDDIAYEYILGAKRQQVMAHVMGFDSESPIHGRPGLGEKVQGELPPIKRKSRIGEKELIRFYQPRTGTNDIQTAIDSVFADAAELAQTIYARLEWLAMQALSEPTLVYDDSGVQFEMDYGVPLDQQYDFTTGLDGEGNPVPGVAPAEGGLADPNFDLLTWLQAICLRSQNKNGYRPAEWVMSADASAFVYSNQTLKDLVRGTGNGVSQVGLSQAEINSLFAQYNLPTITTYDAVTSQETPDGAYVEVRPMRINRSFFVPPMSLGSTLFGPTAESRILFGTTQASQAPGVWASTYATDEPPAEWTKAAAVAFPTIPEAGKISQATLFPGEGRTLITSPRDGAKNVDPLANIYGTSAPNAEVHLFVNGVDRTTLTANAAGAWSDTATGQQFIAGTEVTLQARAEGTIPSPEVTFSVADAEPAG